MKAQHILKLILFFSFAILNAIAKEFTGLEAQQRISGAEKIIIDEKSEIPAYISFRPATAIPFEKFDAWAHQSFSLTAQYGFVLINEMADGLGFTHYRFQQTFQQIPIEGTMYIVHVKNGIIHSMNGTLFTKLQSTSTPVISEQAAFANSLLYMNAAVYRWQIPQMEQLIKKQTQNPAASWFPKARLKYAPANGNMSAENYRLTYCFDVYAEEPLKREYVFVDAISGEVIYTQNRIHYGNATGTALTAYSGTRTITTDSVNATTFRLQETGRGLGIETYNLQQGTNYVNTDFTDSDNIWNNINPQKDQYATDAHWGAEVTYDYYIQNFNRNSVDNAGKKLLSYVHYNTNYTNAFWDGTEMTYGDGNAPFTPLTSLEIAGHEISHGVTENSSGLIYNNESGALNEAFSDCMGNAIRQFGKQLSTIDWLIGNEIGGTPFRSMANPKLYQNPDCYGGTYWNAPNEVHNNSGVMNYWFYLLTMGGSGTNDLGNAYSVNGLGIAAAEAICYRMNAVYLFPSSVYADARLYAIQAAIDLFGPCTNEVIQTTNAWHAVGVGALFSPVVTSNFIAPTTTYCSIPATVNFSNTSSNAGTFTWHFGDGGTSSVNSPVHTYNSYGNFTVTLIADGGSCGTDTLIRNLYISVDTLNPCIVILPVNGSASLQNSCVGQLYDNGGPNGNYTDNSDATVTIAPIGASTVTLNFSSFNLEAGYDYLYVYDGPSTASALIGSYSGTALPNGGTITSTNVAITVRMTSDQNLNFSGFALTWQCSLSNVAPSPAFSANTTTSCTGAINFTDLSVNGPLTWQWDFGDGTNSSLQNPSHTYTASGIYTVSLTVSNSYGSNTSTQINYITINLPVAPVGQDATICPGSTAQLIGNGANVLTWFNVPVGGTVLDTGSVFATPVLNATTTYYVESQIFSPAQFNTPHDSTFGGGGIFTNANYHNLIFNCLAPVKLVSVKVYAQGAGNRTITLMQNGTILQSATLNIPNGVSRVPLNFDLPVGNNLELGIQNNVNLFRNNSGAVFPYSLNGLISITGTNAGASGYYYYFYDWELQESPCVSARIPLTAIVTSGPVASFNANVVTNVVNFVDASTGAVSWLWDFGDPASGLNNTSNLQNPSHSYSAVGTYTITLTVSDGICTNTYSQLVQITTVGIDEIAHSRVLIVFPVPAEDKLTIRFADINNATVLLKINDVVGKTIMEKQAVASSNEIVINVATLAPGIYTLGIQVEQQTIYQKFSIR
jgi:Zn-dependent metalloprotease